MICRFYSGVTYAPEMPPSTTNAVAAMKDALAGELDAELARERQDPALGGGVGDLRGGQMRSK